MVLPCSSQGLRLLIDRSFAKVGLELNVVADIDSVPTRLSIAKQGSACTILPSSAVAHKRLDDLPVFHRIINPSIRRPVSLCWSTLLPHNSASLAVYLATINLLRKFVNDKVFVGATLRPPAQDFTTE